MSRPERPENRSVEYVEGKGWLKTVPAHLIWLNDIADNAKVGRTPSGPQYHVHAVGCGDLRKYRSAIETWRLDEAATEDGYIEFASLKQVVDSIYMHGGSFYEDDGYTPGTPEYERAWEGYVSDFKVFPCVQLPDEPTYEKGPQ